MEQNGKNGWKVRGWSDVLSILLLLGCLISAIAWGLKLDERSVQHEARIAKLEAHDARQ